MGGPRQHLPHDVHHPMHDAPRQHYGANNTPRQHNDHGPYRTTLHNQDPLEDLHAARQVRVEARDYDGRRDPIAFTDWLSDMDHFFRWHNMSEFRCVRFAEIQLIGPARIGVP